MDKPSPRKSSGREFAAAAVDGRNDPGKRLTIHDVARRSNVSVSTVSKALNNNGSLRQETRDRVIAIANELGFRPNDLAQSLHRGKTFTVGLISNDSFGRFTMPILEGLEECLAESRVAVFMANATDDPARETQHVEQFVGKRVDGMIVTARRADRRPKLTIPGRAIPVLYVFSQTDDPTACCLLPDDEGGAKLATEHLIKLGRTRIAHITGPERFEAVRLRRKGYQRALTAAGLKANDRFYLSGVWSESWGREAVDRLFPSPRNAPDAIFCGNDQIARGVVEALHLRGIDVPGAVPVVGFDNWDVMVEATRPPLTSVDMNLKELGREAGRHLLDIIAGKQHRGVQRLPCTLVIRESSAAQNAPRAQQH